MNKHILQKIAQLNRKKLFCHAEGASSHGLTGGPKNLFNGLICFVGNNYVRRNSDVDYPFRQDSNFLYLTGIEEPGYAFILIPKTHEYLLFIPKVDNKHRVWMGDVPDLAESKKLYAADRVFYMDEFEHQKDLLSKRHHCHPEPKARDLSLELQCALAELRFIKSKVELKLMKKAAQISAKAHKLAQKYAKPGLYEYQVQAKLEQVMLEEGARLTAYPSIVGAGTNSAILHYHANSAKLKKGDLLLIDAGAEIHGYASDITRTFPVSGKWTSKQKDIYNIVLKAQKKSIEVVKVGVQFSEIHRVSALTILGGLIDLGLLVGRSEDLFERGVDRLFYPHGVGHSLGLDVHDVVPAIRDIANVIPARSQIKSGTRDRIPRHGNPGAAILSSQRHVLRSFSEAEKLGSNTSLLRLNRVLEENVVVTIEPGIYFISALLQDSQNRKKFKDCVQWSRVDKYLNFGGIRIEDDVVVTRTKPLILSS